MHKKLKSVLNKQGRDLKAAKRGYLHLPPKKQHGHIHHCISFLQPEKTSFETIKKGDFLKRPLFFHLPSGDHATMQSNYMHEKPQVEERRALHRQKKKVDSE